jgi:hypothetical protein
MAIPSSRDNKATKGNMMTNRITQIKCMQINLQHSRNATYNLTQIIINKNIDIAFLQEPYTNLNNVAGFPKSFKILSHGNGRKRSAIIVNNNNIDAIKINQVSDEDGIVMEFSYKNLQFYGASMYFDIEIEIERDIGKVEQIKELAKGKGLILAIDSNARSKLWHDINTNQRGKTLEEFLITSDLHLMNEAKSIPTFEIIRGCSWIDLTLCNNILAQSTRGWTCGEEESCSDHKLICFDIATKKQSCNVIKHVSH